ncbi:ComEC/Rec2 family competence protein [Sulfurospirillum sp. 1307]
MKKVPLFVSKKEIFFASLVAVFLFCISIGYEYVKFKKVDTYSIYKDTFKVLNSYEKISKKGKIYQIIKLKNGNFTFNAINFKPLHVKRLDKVEVVFYTKNIDFVKYLKGFYAPLKSLHVEKSYSKNLAVDFIDKQHENEIMTELYSALFLANPMSKELRDKISTWGISHLVAISGFHFGLIGAILFFIIKPFYTFFQDRFFPYRNRFVDISFLVLILLGIYGYFLDFTPSVLRAFVMSLMAYFVLIKNIKIISFSTLFMSASIILILFPKLLFSIAFWFSICGVFYIFLFLQHFSETPKVWQFVILNFWVYFCMIPIVHYVFDVFSYYQFISPFISIFFVVFYPLALALHLASFGGVFDSYILDFLSLHVESFSVITPTWFLVVFVALSMLSIKYKNLALILPFVSLYILI